MSGAERLVDSDAITERPGPIAPERPGAAVIEPAGAFAASGLSSCREPR